MAKQIKDTSKDWLLSKCKHFTGLMNEVCKADVRYADVIQKPAAEERFKHTGNALPCLVGDGISNNCPKFELYTEEEAARLGADRDAKTAEFMENLREGKICPHCKTPIESKHQVGSCVYAEPCGCRLYQGKLKKDG